MPLCGGFSYLKTRQPIDLELWPMAFDAAAPSYTTIGNCKQQGQDVVWRGETYYWSKHHEFLKFLELPRRRPKRRVRAVPERRRGGRPRAARRATASA